MIQRAIRLACVGTLCLVMVAAAEKAPPEKRGRGMSTNLIKGLYTNWVRTTPGSDNPDLRTRIYAAAPKKIFERARALASKKSGWKIVKADKKAGVLKIEARTRVLRFVDDVIIRVRPADGGGSLVDMESRSRVGLGDFGTNARRVSGFLKSFDAAVESSGEM
ncbi:MAG: DUF1499 domain-containing protein [Myxococcota bacterium]